jgi:hypothetical protein
MKRVLLIGFILAICILAMPQGVLATPPGDTNPVVINALYGTGSVTDFTATLDAPSGGWVWNLQVGTDPTLNQKDRAIHFKVNSLAPTWAITARDSMAVPTAPYAGTKGHMHGDVGDLQNAFQITTNDRTGGWHDLLVDGLAIKSGGALNADQPWDESLRQLVTTTDLASHGGYHTQITFTCGAPF